MHRFLTLFLRNVITTLQEEMKIYSTEAASRMRVNGTIHGGLTMENAAMAQVSRLILPKYNPNK